MVFFVILFSVLYNFSRFFEYNQETIDMWDEVYLLTLVGVTIQIYPFVFEICRSLIWKSITMGAMGLACWESRSLWPDWLQLHSGWTATTLPSTSTGCTWSSCMSYHLHYCCHSIGGFGMKSSQQDYGM